MFELFFVLLAVAISIGGVVLSAQQAKRRQQMLAQVAARLPGGRIDGGGWLSRPQLHFSHRGHDVCLEYYSTGGKHPTRYTDLTLDLRGIEAFKLTLGEEGFFSKMGKVLGMSEIEIGDADFDSSFLIRGSPQDRVRSFLTPEVRQAILEVQSLIWGEVILQAERSALRVRKLGWIEDPDPLWRYLELGQRIFDGYLEAAGSLERSAPVAAAAPEEPPATPEPDPNVCPVCHDALGEERVGCRWCGADHHAACFELNDGCGRCGAKQPVEDAG